MTRVVKSLDRGLEILEILCGSRDPVSCAKIARTIRLDPSSTYRLLATLERRGFVQKNPDTKKYALGLSLVELGAVVLSGMELRESGRWALKELAHRTGCVAYLAIRVDTEALYIDREAAGVITVATGIGERVPGHCTAVGKVLLAALPPQELLALIGQLPLKRYTARTRVVPSEVFKHLREVREQGYALDDEEFSLGIRCIAVPVWDYRGAVKAAIGIADVAGRTPDAEFRSLVREVRDIAEQMSAMHGHFAPRLRC